MREERDAARRNRTDRPEEASFHHLPGDLEDTETAEARENRLSEPTLRKAGSTAAERAGRDAPGEHPPSEPQADGDGGDRPPRPDTWTTKANPLA
jgi:hypothetical protein